MKSKIKLMGLLMCFVATSMMVSCNKDDGNGAKIVGTWGCVHNYTHDWGTDYHGEDYDNEYTDEFKGTVINFKEDGSYTSSRRWYWYIDKDGTWMIDGNSLILDGGALDIKTLNNNNLKLHFYEPAVEGYETEHLEWTLEFKKQ